jgi:glycosyltransferase involved in cell wall biosynthesis
VLGGTRLDPSNEALAGLVDGIGLGDAVRLRGPRDDVSRVMASLDLLVSASGYAEAFPIVLGEAMACGVPCVATDAGDSAFIVADAGRVAPAGGDDALDRAIGELLDLPADDLAALGARARERIATHFDIRLVARRYEAFYDGLQGR